MGALTFIILISALGALVVGGFVVVPSLSGSKSKELRASRKREQIMSRALRQIASGTSGNPTYEAQAALEEVEGIYYKELN